jgi:HPt (histidine-containing phosphotransfer) domain-containing protein
VARWAGSGAHAASAEVHAPPQAPAASDTSVRDPAALEELREFAGEAAIAGFAGQLRDAIGSIRTRWPAGADAQGGGEDPHEELRRIAHKTVSLAGQLGFAQLAEACRRMERACLGSEDVPEALDALRAAITSAAPELESLRDVA